MRLIHFVLPLLFVPGSCLQGKPAGYNPLETAAGEIVSMPLTVHDGARNRDIPTRIYLPESNKAAPVVLFSHGLGGSRDNNPYLGNHWAKRGYAAIFIQHPGSDESVWKGIPAADRMAEMKRAASLANFIDRVRDIPAVLDALTAWNGQKKHLLENRLDLKHIGMSGHSFGAVTTQALAGQTMAGGRISFAEPRLSAAVMMSPGAPAAGKSDEVFAAIKIPCLLMTGTEDSSPIREMSPADRLKVFPAIKGAPAWQVVFDGLAHMDFGGRGAAQGEKRYHKAILALTTAFWDAELKGDRNAMRWLRGAGAKSVLDPKDKWEWNAKAQANGNSIIPANKPAPAGEVSKADEP